MQFEKVNNNYHTVPSEDQIELEHQYKTDGNNDLIAMKTTFSWYNIACNFVCNQCTNIVNMLIKLAWSVFVRWSSNSHLEYK